MSKKLIWTQIKVKLGKIKAWEGNPRYSTKAQAERIIASEKKFGQPLPFILNPEQDGVYPLIDGHQRLMAWVTVYGDDYEMDAVVSNRVIEGEEKQEFIITMHEGATGSWNWDKISGWDTKKLEGWGLNEAKKKEWDNSANNLKEMLASEEEHADAEPQTDRAEELQEIWGVQVGDLWVIGEHRLICGDCTDAAVVARLMGVERADIGIHDPPYGMRLDTDWSDAKSSLELSIGKRIFGGKKYSEVIGDDKDYDPSFLIEADYSNELFLFGADYYAERIQNRDGGSWLVWDKRLDDSADKMYGSCFELCWSKKKHKRDIVRIKWAGVFGVESEPERKRFHPTQKPVSLYEWMLNKYSKAGELSIDFYLGVGSHMIASQNLSRRCYAAEIAPKYVAVSLQRMADAFPELLIEKLTLHN